VNPLWRLFLMTEVNCTGNTKSTKGKHRQCLNLLNVAPRAEFGIAVHSIDMAGAREHNRHSEIRTRFLMPDPATLGLSWRWHFQPKVRIFAVERNCRQMSILPQLWTDDRGQDIAEYAVMLAVILVLVVGTIRLVGSNANNAFSSVASSIQ